MGLDITLHVGALPGADGSVAWPVAMRLELTRRAAKSSCGDALMEDADRSGVSARVWLDGDVPRLLPVITANEAHAAPVLATCADSTTSAIRATLGDLPADWPVAVEVDQ